MDLDLVKLRVSKGFYETHQQVAQDVTRVWENACAFNAQGSIVFRFAQECRAFWETQYAQLVDAHSSGLLQSGSAPRKRKPSAAMKLEGGAPAPAAPPSKRPKVPAPKRAPAAAEATAPGAAEGGEGKSAPPKQLAKGWALEPVLETPGGAAGADTSTPGGPRVRKAKVRWEPEQITASERKRDKEKGSTGASAGDKHSTAVGAAAKGDSSLGTATPQAPGVRKQRRPTGATRCGVHHDASSTPTAAWGTGTALLEALSTPAEVPPAALLHTVPTTLYDVAAALPEIDVGDDLEGVAGDLDGLLDDVGLDYLLALD